MEEKGRNEEEKAHTSSNNNSSSSDKNFAEDEPPHAEKKQPKDIIPDFDEFIKRNNNPIQKLRHGQGYDQELGLTYIGTFPGIPFGHYGISLKKPIRAIHESQDIPNHFADDIRMLGGFTDPLTDKTLGQMKTLLHELHKNGNIINKAISSLAKNVVSRVSHYLDFSQDMDQVLFVLWIIGTYFRTLFTWFPYLTFEGLRDVGKSTALEFLSLTCFNGGGDVSGGHTEADLHKAAASTMGFFAIDHLEEKLKSDDKRQVLNEFLENAWKLNSYVSKRDQNSGERLRLYLACSLALGTRRTTETIAEKGLIIRMQETNNDDLRQRSVTMYKDNFFNDIEKELMSMALFYQDTIKRAYESITVIPGLGREYNKFLPLLAIAKVIDDETNNENDYFNQLKDYALEYRKTRKEEQEDTEEILLRLILKDKINNTTYKALAESMNKEGYEKYSWQTARADIGKLGIVKRYNRNKSPMTLDLDMERAEDRAKARGINLDDDKESKNPFKPDEIITKNENATIDYRNDPSIVERAILNLIDDLTNHTYSTILSDLSDRYPKEEMENALKDMRVRGWI